MQEETSAHSQASGTNGNFPTWAPSCGSNQKFNTTFLTTHERTPIVRVVTYESFDCILKMKSKQWSPYSWNMLSHSIFTTKFLGNIEPSCKHRPNISKFALYYDPQQPF